MSLSNTDIIITSPIYYPPNQRTKLGGTNSRELAVWSEVANVFLPGIIKDTVNFSDVNYYQYSKVFIFNKSFTETGYNVRLYGFNVNNNNVVKMALEKDRASSSILDGEEPTTNRQTAPSLYGAYNYTEMHSDDAVSIGNGGQLDPRTGQRIWLKMALNADSAESALDTFTVGIKYRTEEL